MLKDRLLNKKWYRDDANLNINRLCFAATAEAIHKDVPNGAAWIVCHYAYRQVVPNGTLLAGELSVKNHLQPTS